VPLIRLPRNLHKASKVVLRRFLACGEISAYDRQGNVIYSKGPDAAIVVCSGVDPVVVGDQAMAPPLGPSRACVALVTLAVGVSRQNGG
jgi:hypothetical protein